VRTLNVRLAIILLVIIVVCGTGINFIHYFQQKRNANFFLEQAELAKQEVENAQKDKNTKAETKALEKQLRNLEWYLSFRPNDLDVMETLGLIRAEHMYDPKSYGLAYGYLDKVVREDETRNKTRRKLINVAMLGARYTDALEHINYLLKETPEDPEFTQLLGECEEAMSEYENAQQSYEKAIEYSPKQVDSYSRLAKLLRERMEQPKEAYECMQNMIKNNPTSAKAYIYLGEYWQSIDSKDEAKKASGKDMDPNNEAMKAAKKALELSPDDVDGLLLAARCEMALNDLEKARKYAERDMEIHKDSIPIYTTLADILMRSKDLEKAIKILDQGLKETQDAPLLLWFRANLLIENGNLDEGKKTIEKLQTTAYPKPMIDFLNARISFVQKDWAEASRRLEKVRPSLSMWPKMLIQADLCLGFCYGQLHSVDQQISAYRRVLASDPLFNPARQGLTDALVAAGRFDEAVQEYYKLIQMKQIPPGGLISFANLLIKQNLQQKPDEQKWEPVEKMLDATEKANPDSFQITLLRTEMLHARNRDEEAEILLQKALDKNPKQIEFWNALVSVLALEKKWDQAEKVLADYQRQLGDSVDLRLARSEYLLNRYGTKAGEHLKKLEEKIDGFSDNDRLRLWNGLLSAARRAGDKDLIKQYIGLLAQKDVNNLDFLFLRIEQAANDLDIGALEETLKDVEKVEGQGPVWLFGRARLLTVKANKEGNLGLLDEALQNLTKARELRPSWLRIPSLMGSIYIQQKKLDQGLKWYLEAIDLGEHNPMIVRRTVQLLFQKQRYADANKLLHQLDRLQVPFATELTRLWVQLLIQQGEFDLAMAKARQAVSEKSNEYKDHLWLGQILGVAARRAKAQKQTDQFQEFAVEAEKSLRRAVELKGDVPETWVALVEFLSSTDKISEAEEAVNQASGKIPAEQAPIALAHCYEVIGKNDQALEQYKLAIAAKPDDPMVVPNVADFYQRIGKTTEAETLMQRIINGKVKADDASLFWARRNLALITAAKGGLLNMEAAQKLIDQNLSSVGNSTDDLRIKVKLDSLDPRRSRKDEAIKILTKMTEDQQATPEDRYALAMLYLSTETQLPSRAASTSKTKDGDNKDSSAWTSASNILRNLVSSQDNEPRYLAVYARELLDHGDVAGAELYLNKLITNFPNNAVTIILQAEVLARRNQYEESLDLMKRFVDLKTAVPADRSKRVQMMAGTMEQIAQRLKDPDQKTMADRFVRTAELFYRQYVDEHPSQSLDLVIFFIHQGQIDDAISTLEQTWQDSNPLYVSEVCMNLIQNGKESKDIAQRVEKVLTDARIKFNEYPAIILTLGDIRIRQDRYTEAEKFYRDVLENNPKHAVALNNLAVLLTMQGKKLDEALSLANKAIEITGPLASMLDTRACVYIAQGNGEKALADMEEAIADSATPVRLFHQAQAFNLVNQKYAASSNMQRALEAGLTKEMLLSPEIPAFEKLQKLAKEAGTSEESKN